MGQPHLAVSQALQIFAIYATFSVLGWIVVGIPAALAMPVRWAHLEWPVRTAIGAALGPLALLVIFALLFAQVRPGRFSLAHTGFYWPLSMLISAVAFLVFTGLLRRRG